MKHFFPALRMSIFMMILTGIVYPLVVTGVAKAIYPKETNGSLIQLGGKIVGSDLTGQKFEDPRYFWPRPSAVGYNPLPSGGSNLGQANSDLKALVLERAAKLKMENGENAEPPQDLLFASGSGLDPHISPEAAEFQIARVATARFLDIQSLQTMIKNHIELRQFGFLGEPRVNVLRLNIALDQAGGKAQ